MPTETSVAVPPDLLPTLDAYRTCEFATVNPQGVPISQRPGALLFQGQERRVTPA